MAIPAETRHIPRRDDLFVGQLHCSSVEWARTTQTRGGKFKFLRLRGLMLLLCVKRLRAIFALIGEDRKWTSVLLGVRDPGWIGVQRLCGPG